jgi:hypothetical protein
MTFNYASLNTLPLYARRSLARKIFGPIFQRYVADREYDLGVDDCPWRVVLKISRPDVVITFDDHQVHYAADVRYVRAHITMNDTKFILAPGEYNQLQIDDESIVCDACGYEFYRGAQSGAYYDGSCTQGHADIAYSDLIAYQSLILIEHCIYNALRRHRGPPAMRSDQFANALTVATRLHERFVLHCIWRHRESILRRLPKDVYLIILRLIV